jgi:cell division protein FtsN
MSSGNIKKFELKLGRTGIIIIVAGMTVLLCASFILGVAVGKNIDTYPAKISSLPQQVLSFFWRPAKVAVSQNQISEAATDKGNMDLTFHNDLTQSKTPSIQPPPVAEKKPDTIVTPDHHAGTPVPPPVNSPEEEGVSKKETAPVRSKAAVEKAVPASKSHDKGSSVAAGTSFIIHVASLKEKRKADHINKLVVELGHKSKVVKVDIKGKGIWYRVLVPGFETKAEAKAAVDIISRKVKTNCVIRPAGADADTN